MAVEKNGTSAEKSGKGVTFREALRGYNKSDVNAYLENINLRFGAAEENYRQTIANQKQTIEALELKLKSYDFLSAELEKIKKQADEKIAEYERLVGEQAKQIARLKEESAALEKMLTDAEAENENLSGTNQVLRDRLNDSEKAVREQTAQLDMLRAENERLIESAKEAATKRASEELSKKVGEVLIIAKEEADKMIERAKSDAERVKAEAEEEAKRIIGQAKQQISAMRETAQKKLEESLEQANHKLATMGEEYVRGYSEQLRLVQGEVDGIIEKLRAKSSDIKFKVESLRDIIAKELDTEYGRITVEMDKETGRSESPGPEITYGSEMPDEKI